MERKTSKTQKKRAQGARPGKVEEPKAVAALKALLWASLGASSSAAFVALPRPVIQIIAGYMPVPPSWRLAASPPGLKGPVKRLSGTSAKHAGAKRTAACIRGDTVFRSGRHAWRITVGGLDELGRWLAAGIHQVEIGVKRPRPAADFLERDPRWWGLSTFGCGLRITASMEPSVGGGLQVRSGDTMEFLLDIDDRVPEPGYDELEGSATTLTVTTPRDGRKCVFDKLPAGWGWVPYFEMRSPGSSFFLELLEVP